VEEEMNRYYAAVYYCGDDDPPAFHLIEEGEISKDTFKKRLDIITSRVRESLMMGDETIPDRKIQENIYFFDYDDLISATDLLSSRKNP